MLVKCLICGKDFEANPYHPRKYCTEQCKKEGQQIHNRWNRKLKQQANNVSKANRASLVETTVAARKHGMTYGQYVAEQTKQMVKVVRKW